MFVFMIGGQIAKCECFLIDLFFAHPTSCLIYGLFYPDGFDIDELMDALAT